MLVNVGEDEWIVFCEQFNKTKCREENQPSLFLA
jgi:hypothetical protein